MYLKHFPRFCFWPYCLAKQTEPLFLGLMLKQDTVFIMDRWRGFFNMEISLLSTYAWSYYGVFVLLLKDVKEINMACLQEILSL